MKIPKRQKNSGVLLSKIFASHNSCCTCTLRNFIIGSRRANLSISKDEEAGICSIKCQTDARDSPNIYLALISMKGVFNYFKLET